MSESSPLALNGESKDEERLASCFNCKRSKVKCVRPDGSTACARCIQRNLECAAPLFHVGRHKGVKNKHSGLEKAVFQLEQALKRHHPASEQIQQSNQSAELRHLLQRSRRLLNVPQGQKQPGSVSTANGHRQDGPISPPGQNVTSTSHGTPPSQISSHDSGLSQTMHDDQLNLDDAENPLQLLARTSEFLSSIGGLGPGVPGSHLPAKPLSNRERLIECGNDDNLLVFFGCFRPRLDTGPDLDPIELGLLTLAEAEALFIYFYENLAHTRWGIDPVLHTVDFVRRRSAFLFTSIAAASALFSPSLEALYKRLSRHRQKLADLVMTKRFKSVEIVLAFMINIAWISAGLHWADDETSTFLSMALSIAMDLSLNKIILHPPPDAPFSRDNTPMSDQIPAVKALRIDGFVDMDPECEMGKRLLRRRERTWLCLFVLERGVCLARGRNYILPVTQLIRNCDQWHLSELADRWDGAIISLAVLRRDLEKLIATLRAICDSYVNGLNEASIVEKLKNEITMFFDNWYHTWPLQIGDREQFTLPPYVEILASHTRLSTYSSIINYSSAPVCARQFFRSAGLSSALNVLRIAVQGEKQLRTMPNNTAIMISFAACFALRLSTVADGRESSLAPSIRLLILQTIDVLDRIGSSPVQRKGLSCMFAGQLRRILKLASRSAEIPRMSPAETGMVSDVGLVYANPAPHHMGGLSQHQQHQHQQQHHMHTGNMPSEYLSFSTMSNDQLNEAINNTDVGLDVLWEDFPFQQGSELDWMDWGTFA